MVQGKSPVYSAAVTTHNNLSFLVETLPSLLEHPLVGEVVVLDDASDFFGRIWPGVQEQLFSENQKGAPTKGHKLFLSERVPFLGFNYNKAGGGRAQLRVFTRRANHGAFNSKVCAVALSSNEWVLLVDADNVFPPETLDKMLDRSALLDEICYVPSELNFFGADGADTFPSKQQLRIGRLAFADTIDLGTTSKLLSSSSISIRTSVEFFLNTGNYLVSRRRYLEAAETARAILGNQSPKAADVIWHSVGWLFDGNKFEIVPGANYRHRLHNSSYWSRTKSSELANDAIKILCAGRSPTRHLARGDSFGLGNLILILEILRSDLRIQWSRSRRRTEKLLTRLLKGRLLRIRSERIGARTKH